MSREGYEYVLLGTQPNFSWITGGGDNQIIHGAEVGFVHILVTDDGVYMITNNIERPRVSAEEISGLDLDSVEYVWYEDGVPGAVHKITGGGKTAFAPDWIRHSAPLPNLFPDAAHN